MTCPACEQPLRVLKTNGFVIWCSNAQCPSFAANVGVYRPGLDEAMEQLRALVAADRPPPPAAPHGEPQLALF